MGALTDATPANSNLPRGAISADVVTSTENRTPLRSTVPQGVLNSYFRRNALYWQQTYTGTGVVDRIYQERLRAVVDLAVKFSPGSGCRTLDVGCGAGLASVALARHGHFVYAVDSVPDMVGLTRKRVDQEKVQCRVRCSRGDIHCLAFADNTFDFVIAVGVLPWLSSTDAALKEIHRVLRPGGRLVLTTNNRWGLCWVVDPIMSPILKPVKDRLLKMALRLGLIQPRARAQMMSVRECRRMLERHRLRVLADRTVGFGPFTFMRRELTPSAFGVRLHRELQALADRSYPLLRASGIQHIIAADKPAPGWDVSGARPAALRSL